MNAFRVIIIFVLCALLLPVILLTQDFFLSAIFLAIYIFLQLILLYLFRVEESDFVSYYSIFSIIAGTFFMLVMVIRGRDLLIEWLGFLLLICYFVGILILLLRKLLGKVLYRDPKNDTKENDDDFKKEESMDDLLDSFVVSKAPKQNDSELQDFSEDFIRKPKITDKEIETYDDDFSNSDDEDKLRFEDETPKVDFSKVKENIDDLNEGVERLNDEVKLISEKAALEKAQRIFEQAIAEKKEKANKLNNQVKMIAEKAILEGAQKRLEKELSKEDEMVYSARKGNKYHYTKNCMSLKRVNKKNIISYSDVEEARNKGLKSCGLCRK